MIIFTVRKAENNWMDALGSEIIYFMYKNKKIERNQMIAFKSMQC